MTGGISASMILGSGNAGMPSAVSIDPRQANQMIEQVIADPVTPVLVKSIEVSRISIAKEEPIEEGVRRMFFGP